MNTSWFDKQSIAFRTETISNWSGDKLISGYNFYYDNFNPCDFDSCETFELIKAEIHKRCQK